MSAKESKKGKKSKGAKEPALARSSTGIDGLDEILQGGIPTGNAVLLSGTCGTGKTTACFEILCRGVAMDEPGAILLSVEEPERSIENMVTYQFFDRSFIDDGKLVVRDLNDIYTQLGIDHPDTGLSREDAGKLIEAIVEIVEEGGVKRLAIDSITGVCSRLETRERIRDFFRSFTRTMSSKGVTLYMTSELSPESGRYSTHGIEDVMVDGLILLSNIESRGDLLRTVQVVKMRGTSHSRSRFVMDLTPYGIIIVPVLKSYTKGGGE
jgi:circadian clock protein KaiC